MCVCVVCVCVCVCVSVRCVVWFMCVCAWFVVCVCVCVHAWPGSQTHSPSPLQCLVGGLGTSPFPGCRGCKGLGVQAPVAQLSQSGGCLRQNFTPALLWRETPQGCTSPLPPADAARSDRRTDEPKPAVISTRPANAPGQVPACRSADR